MKAEILDVLRGQALQVLVKVTSGPFVLGRYELASFQGGEIEVYSVVAGHASFAGYLPEQSARVRAVLVAAWISAVTGEPIACGVGS